MGYPNPHESPYDLFMTGHAGCSVSCALGLKVGDELLGADRPPQRGGHRRRGLAVGHRLRGAEQRRRPEARTCWSSSTTTRCRSARASAAWPVPRPRPADHVLPGLQDGSCATSSSRCRWSAAWPTRPSNRSRDGLKALLTGGMLFEELGFRYFGPVDGHDLPALRRWLRDVKDSRARCCCTS